MTPEQARMARALLRMTTRELAEGAGLNKDTIVAIEAGRKGQARLVTRLREFYESKGIFFIPGLDTMHGPAVALRWGIEPPAADQDTTKAGEGGDEETLHSAAWDEEEDPILGLTAEDIEELRSHWADESRWARLSQPSRKALRRAMGHDPVSDSRH